MTGTAGFVTLHQQVLFAPTPEWEREARILWADALLLRGGGGCEPVPLTHAAKSEEGASP